MTTTAKTHRFPVAVHWQGGRVTRACAFDRPDLRVATPPQFRGGVPGVWSPEELLVAAAASCFALTLAGVAERLEVPVLGLDVTGSGEVGGRDDGRFGFVSLELVVRVETTQDALERAAEAVKAAEERCIVGVALDMPIRVAVDVAAAPVLIERNA